jgi:hypothetical protein
MAFIQETSSASGFITPQQVEVRGWRFRESPVLARISRFPSLKIVTKHSLRFAPGICTTIPSKVTPLGARERSSLSLNLLFCSSSVGSLLLQQISLVDNGVLDKTEETPDEILVDFWI